MDLKKKIEQDGQIIANHLTAKNYKIAEAKAKRLLKKFPNYIPGYNLLGLSLFQQDKFSEAAPYFDYAIKLNPKNKSAINNLARLHHAIGNVRKAEELYKRVIKIDSKYATGLNNLATVYRDLNQFEDAIELYKNALKIDNGLYLVLNNLGLSLQSLGKFEEAIINFKKCLEINPKFTHADLQISLSMKYDNEKNWHIQSLKNKIKDNSMSSIEKSELYFGLGKAYEDIKNINKSFENYKRGNELKKNVVNYKIEEEQKLFQSIKKSFSKEIFDKYNSGNKSDKMIFIVGMPRSGTTLVEQIISSHKDIYGAGELKDLTNIILRNLIILKKKEFIFPNKSENENSNLFNKLGEIYIKNVGRFNTKCKHITDKAPLNFRWIGLIKLILPNAKIIHCVRDSKDNCLSLYKNFFVGNNINFSYGLEELAKYYNLYKDLMLFWKNLIPKFIYDISYETLTENQEMETKKLLDFCGLPWDKNCLYFHKNKRGITTASFAQARQPLYKSSVNSWKKFEKQLLPLIQILEN